MLPDWWVNEFGIKPYVIADCLVGMKKIPEASISMVITDPPFNIGLNYNSYNDNLSEVEFEELLTEVFIELDRIVNNGPVLVFFREDVHALLNAAEKTRFKFKLFLKWEHNNNQHRTSYSIFKRYTLIAVFSKGPNTHHPDIIYEDVLRYPALTTKKSEIANGIHPCPMPYKLYQQLIEGFTDPGDIVLDPFLGSGTTLQACKESGRVGLGFDIDENCREAIEERLAIPRTRKLSELKE